MPEGAIGGVVLHQQSSVGAVDQHDEKASRIVLLEPERLGGDDNGFRLVDPNRLGKGSRIVSRAFVDRPRNLIEVKHSSEITQTDLPPGGFNLVGVNRPKPGPSAPGFRDPTVSLDSMLEQRCQRLTLVTTSRLLSADDEPPDARRSEQ